MSNLIRILTLDEVRDLYLPLRMEVLHRELGWTTHLIDNPEELRDVFDSEAIHLGYFIGEFFAGALRIIMKPEARVLPSGPYIESPSTYQGKAAELSKGIIDSRFRGRMCFPRLVSKAIEYSRAVGVVHLFLSAYDHARERRFYAHFGFTSIKSGFIFKDEHISPPESLSLFYLTCQSPAIFSSDAINQRSLN